MVGIKINHRTPLKRNIPFGFSSSAGPSLVSIRDAADGDTKREEEFDEINDHETIVGEETLMFTNGSNESEVYLIYCAQETIDPRRQFTNV